MNFPITLLLNSGLFDFDLTFIAEATLFTILAFVTTNVFLSPISKQLDERSEFINYTLRKATILLTFANSSKKESFLIWLFPPIN